MRPRGRRPAGSDTRAEIVAAARTEFAEAGYAAASIRSIARRAEVDPALVHHYFDGKPALFGEVLDFPVNPEVLLRRLHETPREKLGSALVATFLDVWDDGIGRERLRVIFASILSSEEAARPVREFLANEVFGRLAVYSDGTPLPRAEALRAGGYAAAQLLGVALLRYVIGYPSLVESSRAELVAALGPTVQRYLVIEREVTPSDGAASTTQAPGYIRSRRR